MSVRTRIKRIFGAAATLVTGGAILATALIDANRADSEPLTCAEWEQALTEFGGEQVEFFVAASNAWLGVEGNPPAAYGDRVIGDCADGWCVIPTPCERDYQYPYEVSPAVQGWRLVRAYAHPYIAGAWQALATGEGASSVRYWSVRSEVVTSCLSALTAGQCRTLLGGLDDCWLRNDGFMCRNGLLYGPGLGGVNPDESPATCSPQAGDSWVSCSDSTRGNGWALETYDDAAPAELDLPGDGGSGG